MSLCGEGQWREHNLNTFEDEEIGLSEDKKLGSDEDEELARSDTFLCCGPKAEREKANIVFADWSVSGRFACLTQDLELVGG